MFFVNHWPSRSGGEERSIPARAAAAAGVQKNDRFDHGHKSQSKIALMGDLNDDPISPSVTKVLGAKGKMSDVKKSGLFNPWYDFYRRGIGTLAYQDSWKLFDQIIISEAWQRAERILFLKANIFNKQF